MIRQPHFNNLKKNLRKDQRHGNEGKLESRLPLCFFSGREASSSLPSLPDTVNPYSI